MAITGIAAAIAANGWCGIAEIVPFCLIDHLADRIAGENKDTIEDLGRFSLISQN
jgi:hypothetical protein